MSETKAVRCWQLQGRPSQRCHNHTTTSLKDFWPLSFCPVLLYWGTRSEFLEGCCRTLMLLFGEFNFKSSRRMEDGLCNLLSTLTSCIYSEHLIQKLNESRRYTLWETEKNWKGETRITFWSIKEFLIFWMWNTLISKRKISSIGKQSLQALSPHQSQRNKKNLSFAETHFITVKVGTQLVIFNANSTV